MLWKFQLLQTFRTQHQNHNTHPFQRKTKPPTFVSNAASLIICSKRSCFCRVRRDLVDLVHWRIIS